MEFETLTQTAETPEIPLFYRDGRPFTGKAKIEGRTFLTLEKKNCSRCGGAGGADKWAFTGWTCFECRGACQFTVEVKLYTAEKLAKLDAAQAKREAVKEAKRMAQQTEWDAKVAANTTKFDSENAALLTEAEALLDTNTFVADIIRKGRQFGSISEAQKSAVLNAIASAKRQAEAQAASTHVGTIGDKVKVKVTVTNVASFERTPFQCRFTQHMETVWVISMVDETGNVFVTKTPNFNQPKGETFVLSGTVKDHSEFRGVKQTLLIRAKRTEVGA